MLPKPACALVFAILIAAEIAYADNFLAVDAGGQDGASSLLSFNPDSLTFELIAETGVPGITDIALSKPKGL